VYLTGMPMTLFLALYDAMPRALDRWFLAELIWGQDHERDLNCLSVHLWRLRRQLQGLGIEVVAIRGSWHDRTEASYRLRIEP
jgi:DNA-binding response OmpR family regulator